ncbi:hypothetical protein KNP414_04263 [Paenibacillus mucilaginosus KNP414]|uniref:Uncharacterized protein n=1 Tax=Paenibacillus mucilaginosus (strain KNP414) TaxID=1036673 RepID=F8FHT8_PAEMK|nr:hypothetical protein KNP414_04263 [Paenibacillus mucilaginosus KNP414]
MKQWAAGYYPAAFEYHHIYRSSHRITCNYSVLKNMRTYK